MCHDNCTGCLQKNSHSWESGKLGTSYRKTQHLLELNAYCTTVQCTSYIVQYTVYIRLLSVHNLSTLSLLKHTITALLTRKIKKQRIDTSVDY